MYVVDMNLYSSTHDILHDPLIQGFQIASHIDMLKSKICSHSQLADFIIFRNCTHPQMTAHVVILYSATCVLAVCPIS